MPERVDPDGTFWWSGVDDCLARIEQTMPEHNLYGIVHFYDRNCMGMVYHIPIDDVDDNDFLPKNWIII